MKRINLLLFILSIALLVRLGFIFGMHTYIAPSTEEAGLIAHAISTGKGFSFAALGSNEYHPTAYQAPLFIYFLGSMYFLFGENDLAHLVLELLQSILSVWLCYLIYQIGILAFNKRTGLVAAGIAALYPIFILYSGTITNTIVSTVSVAWFFVLFLKFNLPAPNFAKASLGKRAFHQTKIYRSLAVKVGWNLFSNGGEKDKLLLAIFLGLAAGITILAESIMLSFVILCLLWYIMKVYRSRQFRNILVVVLAAGVVVLPWTIRNYVIFHKFIPVRTMFGVNLWQGNNRFATGTQKLANGHSIFEFQPPEFMDFKIPEPVRDEMMFKLAKQFIISNPGTAFRLFLKKSFYFWWFPPGNLVSPAAAKYAHMMWLPFSLLLISAVIGTGYAIRNRLYLVVFLSWLLFLNYMVVYGITQFGHFRYRAPIEPCLIIFAAYGLVSLVNKLPRRHKDTKFH